MKTPNLNQPPTAGFGRAASDGSALIWHPSTELPPESKTCLCRGDSYDAFTHGGYLLAYVVEGAWVTGKQQNEVTVTEWSLLPNVADQATASE